jgi:catechol 2,3-dioxygenase-like lactoylglutathione lyase family enzyme
MVGLDLAMFDPLCDRYARERSGMVSDQIYRLAPELTVSNLETSLKFWRDLVGFAVAYEREGEGFAFLTLGSIHFMLEQGDRADRNWITAPLKSPLGRGVNFEITLPDIVPVLARLSDANWPLFMALEIKTYAVRYGHRTVRQFLVQDPDGYLLRVAQCLAES